MIRTGSRRIVANADFGLPEGRSPEEFSRLLRSHGVTKSQSDDEHKYAVLGAAHVSGTYLASPHAPGPDLGQTEHHVHLDEAVGRFTKITKSDSGFRRDKFGLHPTAHHYLESLANLNKLAPDLDIKVHGVARSSSGDPQIVTSVRKIEGTHPKRQELADHLRGQGWVPKASTQIGNNWHDPKSGAEIGDAHPGNFIKTNSGKFVPIDVHYTLGKKGI